MTPLLHRVCPKIISSNEAAAAGIQGGTIYDAVLMKSADRHSVDKIFTSNLRHFQAVASPDLAFILSTP